MQTVNKKVAVTPFETNQIRLEVNSGVARIRQKSELTKLTVVYFDQVTGYPEGMSIYVLGECMKHQWAKEVLELEPGKPFILMPHEYVLLVSPPHDSGSDESSF